MELPEKLFHAVHDGDDVCAGLALNIENDGGILVGPGSLPGIFHAIDNRGDVGQPHRSAIAVGDDERAVTVTGNKLIVRADGVGLMQAVEGALGHVDVGLAQRGAQILETQTVRSQRRGIGLDAHGRALSTADTDETNTGELRNFLGEGGVGEIFDFGERERFRCQRERQDRSVGGIDLAINRGIGKALRQEIGGAIDGCLDFLFGDVNVQVQLELKRNDGAAKGTGGGHLVQTRDLAELALERRGHRGGHDLRAGAGIKGLHLNRRVIDLRQGGDGQLPEGDPPNEKDADHQQGGGDRPQNKRP